ncbi:serine hydrolase [Brevibacterium aurantiacum]|uniref:Beta-lactamase family protein n=1 Tax=Brevibacterium aurantiacum TaxID=273384 RepID=A0A556C2R3_BREAU|nr:serine hydrolase domain-containing protein [Brevibacterium aurantiacum]TSI11735.1 beta-lactamase family protein [Brevibacterium aurantiacum]
MSWIVRTKSEAYRLRSAGRIEVEQAGPLHHGDAMLEWGSVTKTVTARIAELLDREGSINLSAPVSELLPETGLPREVDVRSLAEHTSGLPRLPKGMIRTAADARDPYAKYTTERFDSDVLPDISEQMRGPVGSFEYSNLGYAVLTRVLEVATGHDWWTLAERHVFTPLGVTDVSIHPDPNNVPVLLTWAGRACKQWKLSGPFVGAGGLHGTFDALERYATARAQQTPGEKPFGWMDDGDQYWHDGGTLDHAAFVGVSHDGSKVVTVHTLGYDEGQVNKTAVRLKRNACGASATNRWSSYWPRS